MKKFALFLFALLLLVALAAPSYACNPATALAFNQAMYNANGFAPTNFVAVPTPSCGYARVALPARTVGYGVGSNLIIQSGRRNRIHGGAAFGVSSGFAAPLGGTTIIQNGRRNRIR